LIEELGLEAFGDPLAEDLGDPPAGTPLFGDPCSSSANGSFPATLLD